MKASANGQFIITWEEPKSVAAEAYRILRTNLQFASPDERPRTILVTSPGPGDGKSTITANLATSLAQAGVQVIAVNGDLRRPSLHNFFQVRNSVGLTSVLVGQAKLDAALQQTMVPRVRVLPSGPIPPNPSELLGSRRMQAVLNELRELADLLLIDAPPVLAVTDAGLLARIVDACLLVISIGQTPRELAVSAKEQLEQVGARLLGVVANRVDKGTGGYYYYYHESMLDGQARSESWWQRLLQRRRTRRHSAGRPAAADD